MHSLTHKVLDHIRRAELLKAGDRVGIAVSGGADSVALLRLLMELRAEIGTVLSVIHFNHQLRGVESDQDAAFVAQIACAHELELHVTGVDVRAEGVRGLGVEAAARELRYEYFQQLVEPRDEGHSVLDKVATGHTLDDQAETVLMRILRGTGMRGLAGIYPIFSLEDDDDEVVGEVIRPLLQVRHPELEQFLRDIGQAWREDSSNRDSKYTRNRVRHVLLPLLEREFNPAVAAGLSELAEIARGEEDYWQNEISGWMGTAIHWTEPEWARQGQQGLVQLQAFNPELQARLREPGPLVMNATVDLMWLLSEPLAVQRRAVKAIGEVAGLPLEFRHVEEILRFAAEDLNPSKRLDLPLGWSVAREPTSLTFLTPDLRTQERIPSDYAYPLPLPGRAIVPEAGIVVEAVRVDAGNAAANYNPEHLLDPSQLPQELAVRNWRPGDRFWPAHTKAPKKIKELLQERHVTGTARKVWPVVARGDEVVWVRGFSPPAALRAKAGGQAIVIRDVPLEEED